MRLYTCTVCGETRTEVIEKLPDPEKQMGSDGTPVGPGASEQAAEKAITGMKTDNDPKGSVFGLLQLRSPKQTSKSIKLSWKKVPGAAKYVIYGNKCGKTNRLVRQTAVTGASYNFTKAKKETYYKFIVVAVDKEGTVLTTSKVVHVATKGGKVGNHKSVTTKAKKDKVTSREARPSSSEPRQLLLRRSSR